MYTTVQIKYNIRHPECLRPRAVQSGNVILFRERYDSSDCRCSTILRSTFVLCCTLVQTQRWSHITRCPTSSNGKNQCARPRALKPDKKMKQGAGNATSAFTIPFKATTSDGGLYIRNLRRNVCCNHGGQGTVFLFSNSHSMPGVCSLNGAVAFSKQMSLPCLSWGT